MSGGSTTGRLRVLFVAPVEPWCRENGSSVITADLLESLIASERIELLPIFVRRPPPGFVRRPPPDSQGVLLDIPGLPRWLSASKALIRGSSPLRHRFDNGLVARHISQVSSAREFRPDLVHVEHLPLVDIGVEVARQFAVPVAYRAHNIESRLWARRLGLPSPLRRPVIAVMERRELDAIRLAQVTLCISEGDLEWVRTMAPGARSELLPCSLSVERYDAVAKSERVFARQICFVGGLDWAPNEDGLRWFVLEVLPRVTRRMPDSGLALLARGAEQRPWLRGNSSIRILPPESDAAALFASSDVSVAPLFQGGGVRIKIPESLAVGCPVVATCVGAEGHDLPGITRTDSAVEFADACVRYLADGDRLESRSALRQGVESAYGAKVVAERLIDLWSSLTTDGMGATASARRSRFA